MSAAALLALAFTAHAAFGPQKPYGVLLIGEGGDKNWAKTIEAAKKALGTEVPLEFAPGIPDAKTLQKSIDKLEAAGVKKLVAVPLLVSSFGDTMDHVRYLLGIRETAVKAFLRGTRAPERTKSKAPVVLAKALDDHPLFVELLSERALGLSRNPPKETLLLVESRPAASAAADEALDSAQALSERVRQKAGMAAAAAASLDIEGKQNERDLSTRALRKRVAELRKSGAVLVVPLELTPGLFGRRLKSAAEGLFAKYDGKTILPDDRIAAWIKASAESASRLPEMRAFKEIPNATSRFQTGPR